MESTNTAENHQPADMKNLIRTAIEEYVRSESAKSEPVHKLELTEERKRREQLEKRVNELIEENRRSRKQAEEAERTSSIRSELQRLGVSKIDLAFKAVRDDIIRAEDGRLVARMESGEVSVRDYLSRFLHENPELMPGRMQGGSGAAGGHLEVAGPSAGVDIDKIRPGMSAEELEKVRNEIARVARQTMRGF